MDSSHRSETQQIYSLPPLATRELLHMKLGPTKAPSALAESGRKWASSENGAGGRIRTPDLLITNQLLYRLSYTSTWRLSNSKRYYIKEQEACQVKHQKFFSIPLRDSQREPARWLCARCGQEQYSWDGVGVRRGRRLCARCLSRNRIQEEWI